MPTPSIDQNELAASYGWSLAVLRSAPELSKLFDRAVQGSYSQARFVAELRNTGWYKSRSESVRQALVLQKADPAEYNRRVQRAKQAVADQYYAMTGKAMTDGTAAALGKQAFLFGFNEAEVRDMVGNTAKSQTLMMQGGLGGTLGEAERAIRKAADDYGLDFSDAYIAGKLNDIARQKTDTTAVLNNFRQQAKSKYAAFADQLDQGETIKDIAEPYRQMMAKTLEVSDQAIAINDRQIQKALLYRPVVGKKPGPPTPMTLSQFEVDLKNDPRWDRTKNAQDSAMSVGRKVLQDMGLLGGGE